MPDLDEILDFLAQHVNAGYFSQYLIEMTAQHYGMPPSQLYNLHAIYQEYQCPKQSHA